MKHFPGHGSTAGDSHVLLPVVDRTIEQLGAVDLLPYQQAIEAGELDAVMVAHLSVPWIDDTFPTSLSRATVAGLLRDTLRYDGLVMTDELKMGAISARYGVTDAALMALDAGVDVLLADWTGSEQLAVYDALLRACEDGWLSPERVDRSVARILRLKLKYGLLGPDLVERYGAITAALAADTATKEEMPAEEVPPMETPPEEPPTPTSVPTPLPTPVSTQPTPVSIQPTPTRPPPTATASPTPATRTATATATATATRNG
jgi:beta-glucosidase-like glycosyl hydrolase